MSSEASYFLKKDGRVERIAFPYDPEGDNEEWNSIAPEMFLSVNEIAEHQLQEQTQESLDEFEAMKYEDLGMLHHFYGMWLRNNYGLWHPNNPHVVPGDLGDGHPDGLSMLAIQEMHRRLTTKAHAYDSAMSVVSRKAK